MNHRINTGISKDMLEALREYAPQECRSDAARLKIMFKEGHSDLAPWDEIPRGSESCKGNIRNITVAVTLANSEFAIVKREASVRGLDPDEYFRRVSLAELRRRIDAEGAQKPKKEEPSIPSLIRQLDAIRDANDEELDSAIERMKDVLSRRDHGTRIAEIAKDLREYRDGFGYKTEEMLEALNMLVAGQN